MNSNAFPVADTGLPDANRRSVLKALPIAAVSAALPGMALALEADSEIIGLFRARQREARFLQTSGLPEAFVEERIDRMSEIEKEMLAVPLTTLQEFAAKILVSTNYGDFEVPLFLIKEAAAIVEPVAPLSTTGRISLSQFEPS